jgi:RNA polymerase sigma-B factor
LTAALGVGQALSVPSFQAVRPELVGRAHVPTAAACSTGPTPRKPHPCRALPPGEVWWSAGPMINSRFTTVTAYGLWYGPAGVSNARADREAVLMSSDVSPAALPGKWENSAATPAEAPASLEVDVGRRNDETVLRIRGEVDLSTVARFSAALAVGLAGPGDIVIDLRGIAFIDCGGLEALTRAVRQASGGSRRLHILPGAALRDLVALLGGWPDVVIDDVVVSDGEERTVRRGSPLTVGLGEPHSGALVLSLDGEVDLTTVDLLAEVIDSVLADVGPVAPRSIVVELARARFMSAAGVAVVCRGHSRASAAGLAFRLAGGTPMVRRILDITGVTAAVEHYESVDEALDPMRPRRQGRRRDEYAHLAPLFAERIRLPAGHPRQRVLRAELITGYLPVAQNVARKHRYRGENLDDLEQAATLGLINAVDRFEPERGFDFLSFAIPTINGEVQRHYRDRTSTIRVPRPIRELQSRVYQAADEIGQRLGRAATPSELAGHLSVGLDTVIEALQAAYETRLSSLDEPQRGEDAGSDDGTRLADAVGVADPELDLVENRETLAPLLDGLPERERRIVLLRFYGNMTQTEIASRMGISQMHVSRLLASTLGKLRRQLVEE